jgi:uncharacterized phiE125 gp8 family phage protein
MVPRIIVAPVEEPISIEDCREHLRLIAEGSPPEHPQDAMILAQLGAAREWAENFTGRSLAPQTLEIALDAFPCCAVALPRGPVAAVVSITYLDGDNIPRSLPPDAYQLDLYSSPPLLLAANGTDWPTTSSTAYNAVIVRYEAGYSLGRTSPQMTPLLPSSIRAALLLVLGDLYENAEDSNDLGLQQIPRGAEALLRPYRLESSLS